MSDKEIYRFDGGSLFKWDEESNAYIHVWVCVRDNTKAKAIKAYEAYENEWN